MSEKFRKYLNQRCPECGSKLKLIDSAENVRGVTYTESYKVCDECGYEENIKNKHNKSELPLG